MNTETKNLVCAAIESGNDEAIKFILSNIPYNMPNDYHVVCDIMDRLLVKDNQNVASFLLNFFVDNETGILRPQHNVNDESRSNKQKSLDHFLIGALGHGSCRVIEYLLSNGAQINEDTTLSGLKRFKTFDTDLIKKLFVGEQGFRPQANNGLLIELALANNVEMTRLLLDCGADIDVLVEGKNVFEHLKEMDQTEYAQIFDLLNDEKRIREPKKENRVEQIIEMLKEIEVLRNTNRQLEEENQKYKEKLNKVKDICTETRKLYSSIQSTSSTKHPTIEPVD